MSFEDDLKKFQQQVDSFSIAGASGNFHTGFSIGDDTRGAGAGVRTTSLNTPEEILTYLENSFKNFTIRGGHDVNVTGSLAAGGFAISAKGGVPQSGAAVGPPVTETGACCFIDHCELTLEGDCDGVTGFWQGPGSTCEVECAMGACCSTSDGVTLDGGCYEDETKGYCEACCPIGIFHEGETCDDQLGACCNKENQTCTDDVSKTDCEDANGFWMDGCSTCDVSGEFCPGACCTSEGARCFMVSGPSSCGGGDVWIGGNCEHCAEAGDVCPCFYCCGFTTATLTVDVDFTVSGVLHVSGSFGPEVSSPITLLLQILDAPITATCDPDCDDGVDDCNKTALLTADVIIGCGFNYPPPVGDTGSGSGIYLVFGSNTDTVLRCTGGIDDVHADWSGIGLDLSDSPIACADAGGTSVYVVDVSDFLGPFAIGTVTFTLDLS